MAHSSSARPTNWGRTKCRMAQTRLSVSRSTCSMSWKAIFGRPRRRRWRLATYPSIPRRGWNRFDAKPGSGCYWLPWSFCWQSGISTTDACPCDWAERDQWRKNLMSQSTLTKPPKRRRKVFNRLVETKVWEKVSYTEYREQVRSVYAGPKGAVLWACSLCSLHTPLGDRMLRRRKFDLRGRKRILDVGSGAGQIVGHLLKYADRDATITGCDISPEMLRRARGRLRSNRPQIGRASCRERVESTVEGIAVAD